MKENKQDATEKAVNAWVDNLCNIYKISKIDIINILMKNTSEEESKNETNNTEG